MLDAVVTTIAEGDDINEFVDLVHCGKTGLRCKYEAEPTEDSVFHCYKEHQQDTDEESSSESEDTDKEAFPNLMAVTRKFFQRLTKR